MVGIEKVKIVFRNTEYPLEETVYHTRFTNSDGSYCQGLPEGTWWFTATHCANATAEDCVNCNSSPVGGDCEGKDPTGLDPLVHCPDCGPYNYKPYNGGPVVVEGGNVTLNFTMVRFASLMGSATEGAPLIVDPCDHGGD